ncbi:MAG: hypothetical protein HKN85_08090 [Gammaproteobacteria bacterium]|nr:hypothetical protein [Gammaproteobacteria bacterium]
MPIVIHNAIDVAHRGEYVMHPATVKVTVLPAVDTSAWTVSNMNQQVDQVRDLFLEQLDQMVLQRPELKLVDNENSGQTSVPPAELPPAPAKSKSKADGMKKLRTKSARTNKAATKDARKRAAKAQIKAPVKRAPRKTRKRQKQAAVKVSARLVNDKIEAQVVAGSKAGKVSKKRASSTGSAKKNKRSGSA